MCLFVPHLVLDGGRSGLLVLGCGVFLYSWRRCSALFYDERRELGVLKVGFREPVKQSSQVPSCSPDWAN